jgi:type IV secretory pathway TraG/TraD family ATPase VirD4
VSLREGHHALLVSATGSGKTMSARRILLARGLGERTTAILSLDPKGDPGLERDLRAIAARTGRPFVLFDPYDPQTDRWNPVWADDPGARVARRVAPIEADSDSDASHYSRVLRVALGPGL